MKPDVKGLAEGLGMTYDECLDELRKFYDGYHFSEHSEDVFNPFSFVKALNSKKMAPYCFDKSDIPEFITAFLKSYDYTKQYRFSSAFEESLETGQDIIPLLYQLGILSIVKYNSKLRLFTIGVPNKEVSEYLSHPLFCRRQTAV